MEKITDWYKFIKNAEKASYVSVQDFIITLNDVFSEHLKTLPPFPMKNVLIVHPLHGFFSPSFKQECVRKHYADFSEYLLAQINSAHKYFMDAQGFFESSLKFDAILCPFFLHWIDNVPAFLNSLRKSLKPQGVLMAAMIGGNSLKALRDVFIQIELRGQNVKPHILPFCIPEHINRYLLQAGFAQGIIEEEQIFIDYPSLKLLFQDIKHLGQSNALCDRFQGLTRSLHASEIESLLKQGNERFPVTLDTFFITGFNRSGIS